MKYTLRTLALVALVACPVTAIAQSDGGSVVVELDAGAAVAIDGTAGAPPAARPVSQPDASETISSDTDPVSIASEIFSRIRSGEWMPALAAVLIFLVWGIRLFASKFSEWFDTKIGGYAIALSTSLALTLATAISAGEPFSFGLITMAVGAAWAAAGGYDALRDAIGRK